MMLLPSMSASPSSPKLRHRVFVALRTRLYRSHSPCCYILFPNDFIRAVVHNTISIIIFLRSSSFDLCLPPIWSRATVSLLLQNVVHIFYLFAYFSCFFFRFSIAYRCRLFALAALSLYFVLPSPSPVHCFTVLSHALPYGLTFGGRVCCMCVAVFYKLRNTISFPIFGGFSVVVLLSS